jgi:VWFA-related protein
MATDATGLPIKSLDQDVFSVFEDGQSVADFAIQELADSGQPITVVLVLDSSNSMQGKPLEDIKEAADGFLASLTGEDRVGVVSFSDEAWVAADLTEDKTVVAAAISQLRAQGKSPLYDALVEAVGLLKNIPAGRKAIIVLTDGHDDGSIFSFQEALNQAEIWSIPIYPIGFGIVNLDTIEKIAGVTAGYAQVRPDTSELQEAFDTVRQLLRQQYLLEFTSSFPADGTQHSLTITLTYQGPEYSATHSFNARPGEVRIDVIGLEDGQIIGGDVKLETQITSPAPGASVEYQLDGDTISTVFEKPFTYIWEATAVEEGEHTLTVVAKDTSDNTGRQDYIVHIRPPIRVAWETPSDGAILTQPDTLRVEVDAMAGIAKVEFFVDGNSIGAVNSVPYELEWSLEDTQPGPHTLQAVVTDVNNKKASADIAVTVSLRQNTLIFWLALILILATAAIIIPAARRRRRKLVAEQPSAISMAPSIASLFEVEGVQPGREWRLTHEDVRIGRKRLENDIHAAGLSASRRHAVIRKVSERYVLFNLKPENPTLINGKPIEIEQALSPGDVIQIGESVFRFQSQLEGESKQ